MALMDEFQAEREEIKKAPFKKRFDYFWEYYKWWVISGIFIAVILFMIIRGLVTRKNEVLYVALINAVEIIDSDVQGNITEPFLLSHDYEPKKNTILFDSDFRMNISSTAHVAANNIPADYTDYVSITNSANARQTLSVYIASASVDLMVSSENWFDEYAYGGFYIPLTEVLTAEELEKYSDCIYYYDQAVRDRYEKASDEMNYEYNETYPDPYNVEAMEKPVALGLIIGDNSVFGNSYAFVTEGKEDKIVAGFVANSKNIELAHDLLISMLEEASSDNSNQTDTITE